MEILSGVVSNLIEGVDGRYSFFTFNLDGRRVELRLFRLIYVENGDEVVLAGDFDDRGIFYSNAYVNKTSGIKDGIGRSIMVECFLALILCSTIICLPIGIYIIVSRIRRRRVYRSIGL